MSLYRRAKSPFWWSKVYINGQPHQFSTGKRVKNEAYIAERDEIARRTAEVKAAHPADYLDLALLVVAFLEARRAQRQLSDDWLDKIEEYAERLYLPFFGADCNVRTIDANKLSTFKTTRLKTVNAVTIAKELTGIRSLLKFAHEEITPESRRIPILPRIRNPTIKRYDASAWRLLSGDQIAAILNQLVSMKKTEAFPYFLLMGNTAFRGGTLRRLAWEMVDWAGSRLCLPGSVMKNKQALTVELNEAALEALRMMHRAGAIGKIFRERDHYAAWRKACALAGVGKVRPHDLRHTFGSQLASSGASQATIRDLLGHLTLTMANLYAHSYSADRRRAVNGVVNRPRAAAQ